MRFDCKTANAALGHPEATVQMCDPMPHLPSVYLVMLQSPSVSKVVVTDAEGRVETRTGPAVAGAFLDRVGAARARDLTINEVVFALHALGGLPDRFGTESIDVRSDTEGSALTLDPFRLVLLRQLPDPAASAGSGVPGPPVFERATLTRQDDGWRWAIEAQKGGAWVPAGALSLR